MTATDELRAMLDEAGVEYVANHRQTWWRFGTGGHAFAVNDGPTLCVALTGATAAQAIEATLGTGTCHIKDYEDTGYCVCSECGAVLPDDYTVYYCWCCGRKVVSE